MQKTLLSLLALLFTFSLSYSQAAQFKVPNKEHLDKGKQIAAEFFDNLKHKRHEVNADFIMSTIGKSWDESQQITERNDYLNKFQLIAMESGLYGKLDSVDLIQEASLAGSARYFRHAYLAYFDNSLLVFEFRFYVNPKEEVSLHYIGWSETNPFEYMSTGDMVLPLYD